MEKIDDKLVEEAKEFVTVLLTHELSKNCLFHTIGHTLDVLKNAEIIGTYCKLDPDKLNVLRVAALFHDVGYVDSYQDHEKYSAEKARSFLKARHVDEKTIRQIEKAILATKTPQNPQDKLSRILCDADLMNLTFDEYFEHLDLMRKEWEQVGKTKIDRQKFYISTLEFFRSHEYHSRYGKNILQPKKELTERKIKDKVLVSK
jgi:predicted metal-dependent HD superfamily phosphohydrolase